MLLESMKSLITLAMYDCMCTLHPRRKACGPLLSWCNSNPSYASHGWFPYDKHMKLVRFPICSRYVYPKPWLTKTGIPYHNFTFEDFKWIIVVHSIGMGVCLPHKPTLYTFEATNGTYEVPCSWSSSFIPDQTFWSTFWQPCHIRVPQWAGVFTTGALNAEKKTISYTSPIHVTMWTPES